MGHPVSPHAPVIRARTPHEPAREPPLTARCASRAARTPVRPVPDDTCPGGRRPAGRFGPV